MGVPMINRNMEMMKELDDEGKLFDYREYTTRCESLELEPVSLHRFCENTGAIKVGLSMFGKDDWQKSFIAVYDEIARQQKIENESATTLKPEKRNKFSCCGGGEKKSPSMLKKIKNYKETMVRWYEAGRPVVDMKEFVDRLAICGGCESLKEYECTECGCPMDKKAKMDIDKLCELNKW